jgi:hypothetical protein
MFAKTISEKVFYNVEAPIILPSMILPIRFAHDGHGRIMEGKMMGNSVRLPSRTKAALLCWREFPPPKWKQNSSAQSVSDLS